MLTPNEIQSKLRNVKTISTLPQVMTRVMAVVADDRSSAKDLAKEIRPDQAMTSKILKVSNSAYYGFYRKIANIEDAVVVLGFKEIRSLCLAITVFGLFGESRGTAADRRKLWRHCTITAVLAEMLAEPYPDEYPQAFTAGLLHDLGRAVLDQYFPEVWTAVCEKVNERRVHWLPVERELIGTDHAEIGFWLAEQWAFPPALTECIRFHHEPMRAEVSPRLTALVHLANILSRRDLDPTTPTEIAPPLDERVYQLVPLSKDRVEALFEKFRQRQEGVEVLLNTLAPA